MCGQILEGTEVPSPGESGPKVRSGGGQKPNTWREECMRVAGAQERGY